MLSLLFDGQIGVFLIIIFSIIFSLTMHEYGHAQVAKMLGDDTAERAGRLTINPIPHIDPLGLLMVVCIGFGYAKPVPFDVRRIRQRWGTAAVAAAGPLMNLFLAIIAANVLSYGWQNGSITQGDGLQVILSYLLFINILLMLFNLIPIGALDGHYIMEWLLPARWSYQYQLLNTKYGNLLFIGLILLSVMGLPIFSFLADIARQFMPLITFV